MMHMEVPYKPRVAGRCSSLLFWREDPDPGMKGGTKNATPLRFCKQICHFLFQPGGYADLLRSEHSPQKPQETPLIFILICNLISKLIYTVSSRKCYATKKDSHLYCILNDKFPSKSAKSW